MFGGLKFVNFLKICPALPLASEVGEPQRRYNTEKY